MYIALSLYPICIANVYQYVFAMPSGSSVALIGLRDTWKWSGAMNHQKFPSIFPSAFSFFCFFVFFFGLHFSSSLFTTCIFVWLIAIWWPSQCIDSKILRNVCERQFQLNWDSMLSITPITLLGSHFAAGDRTWKLLWYLHFFVFFCFLWIVIILRSQSVSH